MSKFALFAALLAVMGALAATAQGRVLQHADDDTSTVASFISSEPNLSTLASFLSPVHLMSALDEDFVGTVFAPTNDAFDAMLTKLGMNASTLIKDVELLADILYNHGSYEKIVSSNVTEGELIPTVMGGHLTVKSVSPLQFLGPVGDVATVVEADIVAGNAIVQIIDTVLMPAPEADAPAPAPATV